MTTKTPLRSSPLVHILGLGLLLGLSLLIAKGPPTAGDEARRVIVTRNELAHLTAGFMRTWNREPTADELRGELEKFLGEEVLYHEALARGYDADDLAVRRAMQRKMEFLGESQVAAEPPTDVEIRAYFALRQENTEHPRSSASLRSTSIRKGGTTPSATRAWPSRRSGGRTRTERSSIAGETV